MAHHLGWNNGEVEKPIQANFALSSIQKLNESVPFTTNSHYKNGASY
jgi:hypothetical protein